MKKELKYDDSITSEHIVTAMEAHADPEKAAFALRFFKTGKGEYGEGDQFLGIVVPIQRRIAKEFKHAPLSVISELLESPYHEHRLTAGIMLTLQYAASSEEGQKDIVDLYMDKKHRFNGWDLVDTSCHKILGPWFLYRDKAPLEALLSSPSLWDRRIAMVTTYRFIKHGDIAPCFHFAHILRHDKEDLIHKAVGWMLREAGKVDPEALHAFLDSHCLQMPRTMLRYAIEHLAPDDRKRYMAR